MLYYSREDLESVWEEPPWVNPITRTVFKVTASLCVCVCVCVYVCLCVWREREREREREESPGVVPITPSVIFKLAACAWVRGWVGALVREREGERRAGVGQGKQPCRL